MTSSKTPIEEANDEPMEIPKDMASGKAYFEGVGRRKTAVARVRIWSANPKGSVAGGNFTVNDKPVTKYFQTAELQTMALGAVRKVKSEEKFAVSCHVTGGGIQGQAEAVRHGLARALVAFFPNFRRKLRRAGFLTRDPRMVERKKAGLKKARRAPQFSKR